MAILDRNASALLLTVRCLVRTTLFQPYLKPWSGYICNYGTVPEAVGTPINQLMDRLNFLLKDHHYGDALTVFNASERKDYVQIAIKQQPKSVAHVYDSALLACAQLADWRKARKLVKTMWFKRIPVGRVAQACVIKAYCAAGMHSEALSYLKSIPSTRMTIVHANILLSSCASARDIETGLRCWELVQKRKLEPDAATWCDVLRLVGIAHDKVRVNRIWNQAKYDIGDDSVSLSMVWTAYISALAYCGDVSAAADNCVLFMDHFSKYLQRYTENHQELVDNAPSKSGGLVKRESSGPAQHLLVACNTTLHGAADHGEYKLMRRLVRSMNLLGLTPDALTYNALLKANSHRGGIQAVRDGIEEMERLGLSPTSSTYAVFMRVAGAEGLPHVAQEGMNTMLSKNIDPEPSAWAALMQAYAGVGDLHGVHDAYKQAVARMDSQPHWSIHTTCFSSLSTAISKAVASATDTSTNSSGINRSNSSTTGTGTERGVQGQARDMEDVKQRASEVVGDVEAHAARFGALSNPSVLAAVIEAYGMLGDADSVIRLLGVRERLNTKSDWEESGLGNAHSRAFLQKLSTLMHRLPTSSNQLHFVSGPWNAGFSALIRANRFDVLLDCLDHISKNEQRSTTQRVTNASLYISMIDGCTMPPRPALARALLDQMMVLIPMTDKNLGPRILGEGMNAYVKVAMSQGGLEGGLAVLEEFGPGMKEDVRGIAFSALRSRAVRNARTDITDRIKEYFPEQLFEKSDKVQEEHSTGSTGWQGYYASDDDDEWS